MTVSRAATPVQRTRPVSGFCSSAGFYANVSLQPRALHSGSRNAGVLINEITAGTLRTQVWRAFNSCKPAALFKP